MVFSQKRSLPPLGSMYGDTFLEETHCIHHLGINHSGNLRLQDRISNRLQKAKNAMFALASQGVNLYGVNPLVSAKFYKKIVVQTALYGSELWNNPTQRDVNSISTFQHFELKKLQGLPMRTRSDMVENMLNVKPLTAEISKRKLLFLNKLLTLSQNTIAKELFYAQVHSAHHWL